MKKKILLLLLFSPCALFAEDIIEFKNGNRLSGTIINQTEQKIYLNTRTIGPIVVPKDQVKQIIAEKKKTDSQAKAEQPKSKTRLVTQDVIPAKPEKVMAAEKAEIEEQKSSFLQRLSRPYFYDLFIAPFHFPDKGKLAGKVDVSVNVSDTDKKNEPETSLHSYRFKGTMKWIKGKNIFSWDSEYLHQDSSKEKIDDKFFVRQKYENRFTKKYYALAKTSYRKDYKRKIQNEFIQSAELGYYWIQGPKLELKTSAGAAYKEQESTQANSTMEESGEFAFDQSLKWKIVDTLRLSQNFSHIGDHEQYEMELRSKLENNIMKQLALSVEYEVARKFVMSDTVYLNKTLYTGLTYTF